MTCKGRLLPLALSIFICLLLLFEIRTRYELEQNNGTPAETISNPHLPVMESDQTHRLSVLELLTLDASELQVLLSRGNITSVSLVEQVLDQIAKEDRDGANLRAMLFLRPRELILKDAAQLDDDRRGGKLLGPFHGIPIIVKAG